MKIILQHDERDCGAACLAMVAEHYGYADSVKRFRDLTNTDQDGTSFYDMIYAANTIGLSAEGLSGDMKELRDGIDNEEINLPFIAHIITEDNYTHFVVVSEFEDERVCLFDPAKGKVSVAANDFLEMWTGSILTLVPSQTFKKHRKTSHDFLSFFSLLKGQGKRFAAIIIISTLISGIGIIGAFAFQLIIDHSSEIIEEGAGESHGLDYHEHDIEFLTESEALNEVLEYISHFFRNLTADDVSKIFVCLIALYIIAAAIQYVRGRLIITMSKKIDMGLTLSYFNRITDLPMSSVLTRKTGEYMSRYSDASVIRNAISTATITIIIDAMMTMGCGAILYFQNLRLFFTAVVIIAAYLIIVLGNTKRIKDSNREFMENNAYIQSYIKEIIDGLQAIKSVNAAGQVKRTMESKFNAYLDAAVKKSRIGMEQDVLVTVIETVGISVILWQGFTMVIQGKMTLGALITFYALLGYLIMPVKNLIELQPVMQSAVVAAERMNDILEMPIESNKGEDMESRSEIREWEVKAVNFRYGRRDLLLKNVSFSLKKGEKVAVVGESGSGKTTLAKLFPRFYEPESGQIYADGVSLKKYSVESLRNVVAYVSSDTDLFSGTLRDNLVLDGNDYSDEQIVDVCEMTGVNELIDMLPGGLQFRIEEGGANLSSGQKQRIAIARALLRNPKLLIMDEATANLDSGMEEDLIKAVKRNQSDLAILMITHRISTIKSYDKIITLHGGQVVGEGTHSELLENCDAYRMLVADGNYTP